MYQELSKKLTIVSDINRLKIIDMLSCKEMTNTLLLEYLEISQPTLSHHLKILEQNNLLIRGNGTNKAYRLNREEFAKLQTDLNKLYTSKTDCICFCKERNE